MAYGSIICDLCAEILIYDSYWERTSKDIFKTIRLTKGFFSNDHKNCPLSVLWRYPFHREFHYSKSYTKTIGARQQENFYVCQVEVSKNRIWNFHLCWCPLGEKLNFFIPLGFSLVSELW